MSSNRARPSKPPDTSLLERALVEVNPTMMSSFDFSRIRRGLRLTQRRLAEILHVTYTSVQGWEHDRMPIRPITSMALLFLVKTTLERVEDEQSIADAERT